MNGEAPKQGIVAYYSMDGPTGNTVWNNAYWRDGLDSGVVHLDGTDDWIEADATSQDAAGEDLTLSYWLKTTTTSNLQTLAFNTAGGDNTFLLGVRNGNANSHDGSHHTGSIAIDDDEWHHHVVTVDADTGNVTQYVDGQYDLSYTTGMSINTDDRFSIGQEWDTDTPSGFFPGPVDDVRVYTRVLSGDEVQALYNATR